MDAVLKVRSEIYDQFHRSSAGPDYFFKGGEAPDARRGQSDGRELRQAVGSEIDALKVAPQFESLRDSLA